MVVDSIDGASTIDTDGDGHFDDVDNCRLLANGDQHDEDVDAVGDVCDLCPHVANSVTDTDGDGIGDQCDPRPNVAGDVLVRFESFKGTALPSGWTIEAGAAGDYVVAGDALTINAASGTHIVLFDANNQTHAIDVGVSLVAANGGTDFFTALTDAKNDIAEFFGCGLRIDNRTREFFAYEDPVFATIGSDPTPADQPTFPGTFRITSILGATAQSCTIPSNQASHTMNAAANRNNRTFVGLRVGSTTATVRYAVVYRF